MDGWMDGWMGWMDGCQLANSLYRFIVDSLYRFIDLSIRFIDLSIRFIDLSIALSNRLN